MRAGLVTMICPYVGGLHHPRMYRGAHQLDEYYWMNITMRRKDTPWQGHGGYWQPLFIRDYLLPIASLAWHGYQMDGRGAVLCNVSVADARRIEQGSGAVQYEARFIPQSNILIQLRSLQSGADLAAHVTDAIKTYVPERDVLLVLCGDGTLDEVSWLQSIAIAPPTAYRLVCDRWDEFYLTPPQPFSRRPLNE